MSKNRLEEINEAVDNYGKNNKDIFDDELEACYGIIGFRSGIEWADKHPSIELIEKIINMAFDGWDSMEPFSQLAKSIKKEIENENENL